MAQAGGRGLRARQELMKEVFSPVILVVATADVQSLCQRNNLSFAELLQPFSSVSGALCAATGGTLAVADCNAGRDCICLHESRRVCCPA